MEYEILHLDIGSNAILSIPKDREAMFGQMNPGVKKAVHDLIEPTHDPIQNPVTSKP